MGNLRFDEIYDDLKEWIQKGRYSKGDLLPSENQLALRYKVARNTVRRAFALLAQDGYVQPIKGKGVVVIYDPPGRQNVFTMDGLETFGEIARGSNKKLLTKVKVFKEIVCDESFSRVTEFAPGSVLTYIERIRIIDGLSLILDTNVYLKSAVGGLTKEIAEKSIYEYIEKELGMVITLSKRCITAEKATEKDRALLDLKEYDFLAVVTGRVFNAGGVMFEYTQSRHRPDYFCFTSNSLRNGRK